jgi:formate dehydrogenase (coenzyme F420) beta subunit
MLEQVREHVKGLFNDGKISGFVALKDLDGNIVPHLFKSSEELDNGLSLGVVGEGPPARYPLSRVLMTVLSKYPDDNFGVLLRGCDERALTELFVWNQVKAADRIVKVGIACKQELAQLHECRKPFTDEIVAGEKAEPVANASVEEIMGKDLMGRMDYWREVFDRCIKCYGCRDVCPVCFCNVCTLEDDRLIRTGNLPPENPMFHLTRAAHMAGRCIDCNLCTEACPAEIPLRTLYKKVAEIVTAEFGYTTGEGGEGKSPLNMLGPEPGHTAAND